MSVSVTIRSELTKIITLPSFWVVTGILVLFSVYMQVLHYSNIGQVLETLDAEGNHWWYGRPGPAAEDIVLTTGAALFNIGVLFFPLGAVIAGAEFRSGQLGVSVLAMPNRVRWVLGKTVATAICALALGLLFAAMTLVSTYLGVKDWEPGLIWRPGLLLGLGGAVLLIVAITVLSFAVTLLTRRTLSGILVMGVLIAVVLTQVLNAIAPVLDALTPISAARNWLLQDNLALGGPPFSSSPTVGAVVLFGWVAVTVAGATLAIQRRDAR